MVRHRDEVISVHKSHSPWGYQQAIPTNKFNGLIGGFA